MEFCVVPQAREFGLIKRTLSEYLPGVVGVRDVVNDANTFRRMQKGGRFADNPLNFALVRYVLVHSAERNPDLTDILYQFDREYNSSV